MDGSPVGLGVVMPRRENRTNRTGPLPGRTAAKRGGERGVRVRRSGAGAIVKSFSRQFLSRRDRAAP